MWLFACIYVFITDRVGEAIDPGIMDHLHKVVPPRSKSRAAGRLNYVGRENGLLLDIEQGDVMEDEMEAPLPEQGMY